MTTDLPLIDDIRHYMRHQGWQQHPTGNPWTKHHTTIDTPHDDDNTEAVIALLQHLATAEETTTWDIITRVRTQPVTLASLQRRCLRYAQASIAAAEADPYDKFFKLACVHAITSASSAYLLGLLADTDPDLASVAMSTLAEWRQSAESVADWVAAQMKLLEYQP